MIRSSVIFVECCIFALAKHRKGLLTCYFCQSFNEIWLSNVFGFIPMSGLLVMNYFTVLKLYILVKLETLLIFSWNVTQTNGLLQYRENFKLSLYIFGEVAPGPSFTKLPRTLKWSHCSSTKNPLHHVGGIYIFLKKTLFPYAFFLREWNRNNKTSVDIHTFKRLPT